MNLLMDTNETTTERPEPFATVLDLIAEHGEMEVLGSIADKALFDSEDKEHCPYHRKLAARLNLELEQLLERMARFEDALKDERDVA